jgi:hypothetical protein
MQWSRLHRMVTSRQFVTGLKQSGLMWAAVGPTHSVQEISILNELRRPIDRPAFRFGPVPDAPHTALGDILGPSSTAAHSSRADAAI